MDPNAESNSKKKVTKKSGFENYDETSPMLLLIQRFRRECFHLPQERRTKFALDTKKVASEEISTQK